LIPLLVALVALVSLVALQPCEISLAHTALSLQTAHSSQTLNNNRSTSAEIPTVGMTGVVKGLTLGGSELVAKELNPEDKMVVRIAQNQPHGELRRYQLEYWGMEPGQYDLRDYLKRIDGSDLSDVDPILVNINAVVVTDNGMLNDLVAGKTPTVGGYRLLAGLAIIVWVIGGILILTYGRKKRSKSGSTQTLRSVTWAEKLRPLLEQSQSGQISAPEQAELERLLVTFWRDKLDLNQVSASQAIDKMKLDPTAGRLISQLENWLHSPTPNKDVDINELLKPYDQKFLGETAA